ncbi:hypothetical protein COLO4_09886 [Corchorus olitorius]|uniref:Uncharacterized protein n=1 Tax=Corchorus olitorius TaxID=93759 RepID=A0A1R3KAN0_9ROSI|nr:hypothetical protein COLO4_09886 [Corchorus olitorius]
MKALLVPAPFQAQGLLLSEASIFLIFRIIEEDCISGDS